jgi:hypothetical protein
MSRPQTGHGPRLARGIRTSFNLASSSPTVEPANFAMSAMNAWRCSAPRSMASRRFSQSPVSDGDVSGCSPSSRITFIPFSVGTSARPSRST